MCRTLKETVENNVSFFLREKIAEETQFIQECGCTFSPLSRGWECSACVSSRTVLEVLRELQGRPRNSWGRRSWVFAAQQAAKYHDEGRSHLGATFFEFSRLLWLAAHDAVGTATGSGMMPWFERFDRTYDSVVFHWNAANTHPYDEDYFSARGAALWMEGR